MQLLFAVVVVLAAVIVVRLVRIQVVDHERYRARADGQWFGSVDNPAVRGKLHDRNGRLLAVSTAAYRVGIASSLFDGADLRLTDTCEEILGVPAQELEQRIEAAGNDHIVIAPRVKLSSEDRARFGVFRSVTIEELQNRIYPFGDVGASVVGLYRDHGGFSQVATGLEYGLDDGLRGSAGKLSIRRTGRVGQDLSSTEIVPTQDGRDYTITLDISLQKHCEDELAKAVIRFGATGGQLLVLEPFSGDILAAASWPVKSWIHPGRAHSPSLVNACFTTLMEPGGLLHPFTAGMLLSNGAIDPESRFDVSEGDFGVHHINDPVTGERSAIGLEEALVLRSNRYFARAIRNLSSGEIYRSLVGLGFRDRLGLPYGGLPNARVYDPSMWRDVTPVLLANGYDLKVTPLHLGLAACAIANGGRLIAPRLVLNTYDPITEMRRSNEPRLLRRVFGTEAARYLRELMQHSYRVSGGVDAADEDEPLAAVVTSIQSRTPNGCFVCAPASYGALAIAPADTPSMVIVMIVEGVAYGAGTVPSFRGVFDEIYRGIRNSSPYGESLIAHDAGAMMRTDRESFEQVRDQSGVGVGALLCADFRGFSSEDIRRWTSRRDVPLMDTGSGRVFSQAPRAGEAIGPLGIRVDLSPGNDRALDRATVESR